MKWLSASSVSQPTQQTHDTTDKPRPLSDN